jgi:uncharacterized membrane protein
MNTQAQPFELGKNRIEALSDGIFAIVMTLLIFELKTSDLPQHASNIQLAPALFEMWPKFLSYIVSFIGLGIYWVAHHYMYHSIRHSDRVLLWLNILFFMFVSLLPFSTSLINSFGQTQIAPLFFGANLTLIGWALYFQWIYATSKPDLMADFVTREYADSVKFRFLIIPIIATITMLVCFWSVEILLIVYALLLPFYTLTGNLSPKTVTGKI